MLPGANVKNVEMFYWIYFAMTGMHAIHMIIGVGLLSVILFFAWRGRYGPEYHNPVEISGTVLALRRHHLDFSVSVALFAGPAPGTLRCWVRCDMANFPFVIVIFSCHCKGLCRQ